tara:strand:- start:6 stop:755 length:750 start_codon:yes stop_codon:yes gene_type:complete
MKNRLGLITGCGKGIGLAAAKNILKNNSEDKLIGISRSHNNEIKKLIEIYPERFIFETCDISNYPKIDQIINELKDKFGTFDYAICNAGLRSRKSIELSTLELYRNIFEVNTLANINIAKKLIESSKDKDKHLNILFISSIVGARGFDELSTYAVSKSALEGFVKSAAVELAKSKIQLNCLSPGFIASSYAQLFQENKKDLYKWTLDQTPMGRWGSCEEIANFIYFLISEENSYMTGSVLYCDGGWTAK